MPIEWTKHNFLWQGQKWKYQGGVPKQEYLEPGYDDHLWSEVHTDSIQFVTNDKSRWQGIGTFRQEFSVAESFRGKLAELILLRLAGAVDIYLDGRLITQLGTVATNATDEVVKIVTTPKNPVQVELDDKPSHVITVVYSNHDSILRKREWGGFVIMFAPDDPAIGYTKDSFPHGITSMSIILTFCLFFWFVYAFFYLFRWLAY